MFGARVAETAGRRRGIRERLHRRRWSFDDQPGDWVPGCMPEACRSTPATAPAGPFTCCSISWPASRSKHLSGAGAPSPRLSSGDRDGWTAIVVAVAECRPRRTPSVRSWHGGDKGDYHRNRREHPHLVARTVGGRRQRQIEVAGSRPGSRQAQSEGKPSSRFCDRCSTGPGAAGGRWFASTSASTPLPRSVPSPPTSCRPPRSTNAG